ncbi:uncharacterized protein NEMAJ01_1173 [Nematocida major]|uniref:uncharacterized protein n=1 Tax=Nematocida major TaxID=1912982 RepID=UPI0020073157|nr:uncharacterized protein NEMAJ01_1173 [Nematocida major]KAH9386277.1 hypothetical protein NEMAJ01_1173 [Nematocida major]
MTLPQYTARDQALFCIGLLLHALDADGVYTIVCKSRCPCDTLLQGEHFEEAEPEGACLEESLRRTSLIFVEFGDSDEESDEYEHMYSGDTYVETDSEQDGLSEQTLQKALLEDAGKGCSLDGLPSSDGPN